MKKDNLLELIQEKPKTELKAWFSISNLQKKVGVITDRFGDYIELKEVQRGDYYIKHESEVTLIKN